jgi:hypothetical protein
MADVINAASGALQVLLNIMGGGILICTAIFIHYNVSVRCVRYVR